MIYRHKNHGQKLDVAGLNEITVLIDRSETELTEVAINTWQPGLDGPPHQHERKEQNFLVLAGEGDVIIGSRRFPAMPGSFFFLPAGVVHQTITRGLEPLSYFLFNAFLDTGKEGHASFAEHIAQVKHVRREQADRQRADVPAASASAATPSAYPGKCAHLPDRTGQTLLLGREESARCEAIFLSLVPAESHTPPPDSTKEQTLYVLTGSATVRVSGEEASLTAGDTVFIPRGQALALRAGPSGVRLVSFGTVHSR